MPRERDAPDTEEMQKRIERLEEGIEEVKKQARDAGLLEDPDQPRFHESGEESDPSGTSV